MSKQFNILSRDDILKADDIKIELVPVPEWGGAVYVRGWTGAERDDFEGSIVVTRGKKQTVTTKDIRAKMAAKSICDADGKLLFTEADIKALTKKNAGVLQRIMKKVQALSGIGDEDIEEMAEDLKENPFEGSPSD